MQRLLLLCVGVCWLGVYGQTKDMEIMILMAEFERLMFRKKNVCHPWRCCDVKLGFPFSISSKHAALFYLARTLQLVPTKGRKGESRKDADDGPSVMWTKIYTAVP